MLPDRGHIERIKRELREAGATAYGLRKFASKYLPAIIHEQERVEAVVYGHYGEGDAASRHYSEGMLVATDRRVIFLDHKPGCTATDEVTYGVVTGVRKTTAGLFVGVTLHTRITDYTIRYANRKCADNFVRYIEDRCLESLKAAPLHLAQPVTVPQLDAATLAFLEGHELAVLSTVDRAGNVHGAVVYYVMSDDNFIYVLTKAGTQKAHDIFAHHQVALTVFDASTAQTVQVQGIGEIESDKTVKDEVFAAIIQPRDYGGEVQLPPVTALHEGAFMVLKIGPMAARFTDYRKRYKDDLDYARRRLGNQHRVMSPHALQ